MNKDIKVSISQINDVTIINIKGDVTAVTGEVIKDAYMNDCITGLKKILFAFDKDCYIDSGGLAFLIDIDVCVILVIVVVKKAKGCGSGH